MKQYDHEPTMSELLDQLEKEMKLPNFIPEVKIPILKGGINKMIKKGMRKAFVFLMFS